MKDKKHIRRDRLGHTLGVDSVSARPEFFGVIDDPLFENLGVIGKFRGSERF